MDKEQQTSKTKAEPKIICPVCPRHCALREGECGFCRARVASGGEVVCENYGRLTSLALDPIEKKPFARFHSGGFVLSAGSYGCNMRCPFCQNHEISQAGREIPWRKVAPAQLVTMAEELRPQGNIGLAFTYNEPAVGYEYARDAACLAKERGFVNVMVSNGYVCEEPLAELLGCIDAFNIDLKCFTEEGYRRLGGTLAPVKSAIEQVMKNAHLEVTTLVVPGLSDSEEEMEEQCRWLASLSPEVPLHLSRYFPGWKVQEEATSVEKMKRLAGIARTHLQHVYLGNC